MDVDGTTIIYIVTILGVAAAIGTLNLRMSIRLEQRIDGRIDRLEKRLDKLEPRIRRAKNRSQRNLEKLARVEGMLSVAEPGKRKRRKRKTPTTQPGGSNESATKR